MQYFSQNMLCIISHAFLRYVVWRHELTSLTSSMLPMVLVCVLIYCLVYVKSCYFQVRLAKGSQTNISVIEKARLPFVLHIVHHMEWSVGYSFSLLRGCCIIVLIRLNVVYSPISILVANTQHCAIARLSQCQGTNPEWLTRQLTNQTKYINAK